MFAVVRPITSQPHLLIKIIKTSKKSKKQAPRHTTRYLRAAKISLRKTKNEKREKKNKKIIYACARPDSAAYISCLLIAPTRARAHTLTQTQTQQVCNKNNENKLKQSRNSIGPISETMYIFHGIFRVPSPRAHKNRYPDVEVVIWHCVNDIAAANQQNRKISFVCIRIRGSQWYGATYV